jgi:gluconokinase
MARMHGHALPARSALPFRLWREVPQVIVVVMGVAGAGKTTVGSALARALGWAFIDGDDMHPTANVDKMRRGEPLDDNDRMPWLEALAWLMAGMERERKDAVFACSALREVYRAKLSETSPRMLWVYLRAEPATIRTRLTARRGHFAAAYRPGHPAGPRHAPGDRRRGAGDELHDQVPARLRQRECTRVLCVYVQGPHRSEEHTSELQSLS